MVRHREQISFPRRSMSFPPQTGQAGGQGGESFAGAGLGGSDLESVIVQGPSGLPYVESATAIFPCDEPERLCKPGLRSLDDLASLHTSDSSPPVRFKGSLE
jgi:hypothetical protein